MEPDFEDLSLLFPNLAAQLRNTLSTMHLAASQLAPSRQREQDPALDAKAALLLLNQLYAGGKAVLEATGQQWR